jgi:hypothetical protein
LLQEDTNQAQIQIENLGGIAGDTNAISQDICLENNGEKCAQKDKSWDSADTGDTFSILTIVFIFPIFPTGFPAGKEAIISQFRVWPFLFTIIMAFGERNRNPGHHFAG